MANFQKIRTLAEERGMTLSVLAEQIGMTPTGLGLVIKSGKTMTDKLEKIAQVLKVRVGVFFEEDEENVAPTTAIPADMQAVLSQKDKIIAQKDAIIEQKDAIISTLINNRH